MIADDWHWLFVCIAATDKDFGEYAYRLNYEAGARYGVRWLRGHKMHSTAALDNEFAAALQFPWYFGENWPALSECIRDLEWLPAEGYIILISRTPEVLKDEPEEQFAILVKTLARAAEEWRREQKPFRVVLQCEETDVALIQSRARLPFAAFPMGELPLSRLIGEA